MAAPTKTWKSKERKIAGDFGTKRTPLSGINSGHETHSDSLHPSLYLEVKYRKKHTALTLYRDTATKAKAEGKTPVVALGEKGRDGYWLLLHADDLKKVAEEYKKNEEFLQIANTVASGSINNTTN